MLKHLCIFVSLLFKRHYLDGRSEAVRKDSCAVFPSIYQEENKTNTRTTSKGLWAMLNMLLRSTEHCPVHVSLLLPWKPLAEGLLPLPLSCFTSCFILKHNSASLPHYNALHSLRIKLLAAHKHAGSTDVPVPHQASEETKRSTLKPDSCHSDLQANVNVTKY